MSIYFQFPAIDEYPVQIHPSKTEDVNRVSEDEDKTKQQDFLELKDFLTLKSV